ncbi:MAG TPA: Gfo/Idh/MocA family oxidoreductase [Opitutaceae bacterium]|nr:Gfo/Idh/MocA family oxidoreductase [Opitutaceae bacterium]HRE08282.1 Gfo/Idh/MocA family oxidoreductase [Opitutaceae bacterium]
MKTWSRKDFIRASMIGGGALLASRSSLLAQKAPAAAAAGSANSDIRIAVVGVRSQGAGHMKTYYAMKGTRLVAICDADRDVLGARAADAAKEGIRVETYLDYRKLLESKDVDAVVIATPNHWHSLMTIWALQAGKDVYVEKPLSHNIWEGRQAVEATNLYSSRIVQAGTQNRSSVDIRKAIEYVRSGQLGKIQHARGLCYKARESIGKTSGAQIVSPSIDYDLWTGPADLVPPHRNGARGSVHYDWHWFWNYGGGDISNQGIHQVDVARWFLGEDSLPKTVMSMGGRFGLQDDAETPNTEICIYGYEKAPMIFEVRGLPTKAGMKAMDAYKGARVGVIVQCEGGYVHVGENGTASIYDNAGKKIQAYAESTNGTHRANFVEALKSRDRSVIRGRIENSHISTALCHLGNISYLMGKEAPNSEIADAIKNDPLAKETFDRMLDHLRANAVDVAAVPTVQGPLLTFDPATEQFVGGNPALTARANTSLLLKREGRGEFKIPTIKAAVRAT